MLNLDGLWVQQVSYVKFSVNIRWDRVWRVPTGQKSSPPTLVTYPNKAETLIADDRLYVWVGYKGGRATFLAGGYPPYPVPSDINRKFHIGHLLYPKSIQIQQNTWDGNIFFFKLDLKWVFYSKKVEFLASNIII